MSKVYQDIARRALQIAESENLSVDQGIEIIKVIELSRIRKRIELVNDSLKNQAEKIDNIADNIRYSDIPKYLERIELEFVALKDELKGIDDGIGYLNNTIENRD